MFAKITGFEFRYQLRQPIFWIALLLFALLAFGSVASSNIQLGSSDNIHKNAAFVIAQSSLIFAVIYMFVVVAFVANVIVRDDDTGFGAIIRTTPIRKFEYLYGRFTGAFAASAVAFLAVPVGLWLGSLAPWVDRQTLGPVVLGDYVYAYVVLALPILFVSSALFFTLTTHAHPVDDVDLRRPHRPLGAEIRVRGGPQQARSGARRGALGAFRHVGLRRGHALLDRQRAQYADAADRG